MNRLVHGPGGRVLIRFEQVTKRFPDGTVAVSNLDLDIDTGRITVLVGASGCGKTTTLRMINRMIEPTGGRILIDGKDVQDSDPPTLRRQIGYVIQQAGLFPHRTVARNIATVPLLLGWSRKKAKARALELLELVGLPAGHADRYPHQLSGGQQQRVGVARALAADPPVLLMDEPFSAVDPVVRAALQDELLALQTHLRKTIVFVTHDIDEAIRLGDKVGVFRPGGGLVQYDTPERLLAAPKDAYVDDFLGTDRGLRRLSTVSAAGLTPSDGPAVTEHTPVDRARQLAAQHDSAWLLVCDPHTHPLGWARAADLPETGDVSGAAVTPVGRVFRLDGDSMRGALDSAVMSPAGLAVAVDADGRLVGTVPLATIHASTP
ncbi:ABC transporter ATP-binding protein [Longispora urticae]